jgi:ABC-type multidrug transport system ATPase subunit
VTFLEAAGVTKRYRSGTLANDALTLSAELGEVLALVGPNGAGKTTFVLQLIGLLTPTAGAIRIGDVDVVASPDAVKPLIGYQPQGHMAMGGVEVEHVLAFTGRLRGLTKAEAAAQTAALAAEFDLGDVLRRPLNRLSGGWRRLVDVAVAFAGRPRLIVLDEPTENLDPVHRRLIWKRLDALRESRAATCLLVTHNLLEAERVVDRVVIVDGGRIVQSGSPGALKQRFGRDVLLDVHLRPGAVAPAALLALGTAHAGRPGHVQLLLAQQRTPAALRMLLEAGASAWLDDFRLGRPSLETIYLGLGEEAAHAIAAA